MLRLDDRTRPWWTLAGACFGLFLLMLDSTVVALALTSIKHDLSATSTGLQWVMNGYLLVMAALIVTVGRLGDILGRKKLFQAGMVVFAAGSVISGAAPTEEVLILGRLVQGAGGAALLPLSLAIVCNAFPRAQQPRALGIWAGISAVALGIGPLLGGVLVGIDWRLIFWINPPIAAIGIAIMAVSARESTDPTAARRIDVPGFLTLTPGLILTVLAIVESQKWGFGSAKTLGVLAAGLTLLVAFWFVEHRVEQPIVDFELFRNGPYFGASAAAFALVGAYWAVMYYQPQYLQDVQGYSPTKAGLLVLPITVPMIFISPYSGRLIARFGARGLMTVGMAIAVAGLAVLTQLTADSSYVLLLVGYLLFGIALGFVYAPMSTAAMAAMPSEKVGIASGVLGMDRLMAGAVTLAVSGAVFSTLESNRADQLHASGFSGNAFAHGVAGSTWVLVGLCLAGAILTWAYVRDPDPAPGPHAGEPPEHHQHHRRFHL